jgi:intergrase/recombinase
MRNFYFFTSKKITTEDCFEALSEEMKYVESNGVDIWINAKSKSFITFCNESLDDFFFETTEEKEEFKRKIPIENPYVNNFETHRSIDLKRVIKVLMKLYPELYIDDDGDFTASAQEYLDTEFDY